MSKIKVERNTKNSVKIYTYKRENFVPTEKSSRILARLKRKGKSITKITNFALENADFRNLP